MCMSCAVQPLPVMEADILHMDIFNVSEVSELNHLGILYKEGYRSEVSFSSDEGDGESD